MATPVLAYNQRCILECRSKAKPKVWRWSGGMARMVIGIGAFVALLNMLSLLVCIEHCAQESPASVPASAWFLRGMLLQPPPIQHPDPPLPHHHHTAPRGAFERILVQVGLLSSAMLLVGRLSLSACPFVFRLTSAPPTPPPRAA